MAKKKIKPSLNQADIEYLRDIFLTKEEFADFKFELNETLKEQKSDIIDVVDKVLKEIIASREEETVMSHQISDHEDRISVLEAIHPSGQH